MDAEFETKPSRRPWELTHGAQRRHAGRCCVILSHVSHLMRNKSIDTPLLPHIYSLTNLFVMTYLCQGGSAHAQESGS